MARNGKLVDPVAPYQYVTSITDIVELVRTRQPVPYRPQCPPLADEEESVFRNFRELMLQCWSEMAEDRPDIDAIKKKIREINKGKYVRVVIIYTALL